MADQAEFDQMAFNVLMTKAIECLASDLKVERAKNSEQDGQIGELQSDRTATMEAVTDLQAHKEVVSGAGGLTAQLGNLAALPALRDRIIAALPEAAEAAASTGTSTDGSAGTSAAANEPANGDQHQAAA